MSEPVLRLDPTQLSVDPGGVVTTVLTVYNPGHRVEGYDLDVVAQMPLPWATVSPPTVSVYPQQEETAVVTFSPPSGADAPGGAVPFGVRARSQVDGALSSVVEGDLDVGAVSGLQATLTPVTSSGRWSGRHTVKVSNWGNAPARLRVVAQDPDQALGFLVTPPVLDVPLGRDAVARVKVRTRHPVLRGTAQKLPFQVVCEPEEPESLGSPRLPTATPERPVVDGAFNQKPILTRMVVVVAGLLLLALVAGLVWLLTRPDDSPPAEEEAGLPPAPTALQAVANTSPTEVVLAWEAVEDVDGYKITTINPDTGGRAAAVPVDDPDATTAAVKLPPSTRMCFQIRSFRGEVDSELSPGAEDEVCDETEAEAVPEEDLPPGVPSPAATVEPDTEEVGGGEPTAGGGTTGGGDGTDGEQGAPPQDFITVYRFYSSDQEEEAVTEQQRLGALGVTLKRLSTEDYGLGDPAAPSPTGSPASPSPTTPPGEFAVLLYVDGPSAAEAQAACAAAQSAVTAAGEAPYVDSCKVTRAVTDRPEDEAGASPSL